MSKLNQITQVQADTLTYMTAFYKQMGRRPTYREIADHFGLSSASTAHTRVRNIEKSTGLCPWCQQELNGREV